jgi:hypothetical protein
MDKDEIKDVNLVDTTTVEETEIDLDSLFGSPGADSILVPEEGQEAKPKNIFSKEDTSLDFLNGSSKETKKTEEQLEKEKSKEDTSTVIDELDELISKEEETGDKGKPKVEKEGLHELASKMIEEGSLFAFDDDKPLEEYSTKDFRELFEANFKDKEAKVKAAVPKEFFDSLPSELQVAAKYVADGGQDLKGLFKTLSQVEEVMDLSPDNVEHQEEITRQYLYATNFGSAEEIEAEIEDYMDLDRLEQKAKQYKPKLDKMQESIVQQKLAKQEESKGKQQEAAKKYTDNVYETLVAGELDGVKLDKKTQSMLYSGLVQPNYPSISGKNTNLLGHLLEKYQFVEPRHDLIAEALWLLSDPEGYKGKIQAKGGQAATENTVRMLKTEEGRKISSSTQQEAASDRVPNSKPTKTVARKNRNIFGR